jgi:transcriptional regulator with XRE-family HTH domain
MYTTQSPTFGLLLKRHRRAAGMTQEELAERTGVSVRAISDLERGLRQPRRDTLQLLLDTLQLGADEQARLEAAVRTGPSASEGAGPRGSPLQTEGSFLGALRSTLS